MHTTTDQPNTLDPDAEDVTQPNLRFPASDRRAHAVREPAPRPWRLGWLRWLRPRREQHIGGYRIIDGNR